jgi:hypothetical protein
MQMKYIITAIEKKKKDTKGGKKQFKKKYEGKNTIKRRNKKHNFGNFGNRSCVACQIQF